MILENFESFNNNYCVYIYFDPRKPGNYIFDNLSFDFEPIYVGKGKYNRPKRHLFLYKNSKSTIRFHQKIRSIIEDKFEPIYKIVNDGLSELEAFTQEIYLIGLIGRIEKGGSLLNLTDGGDGQSGYRHSSDTKLKISNSLLNNKEWLDKIRSVEFREKISKGLMGHPGYGKGIPRSEEVKDKIRKSVTGDKNHFFGKKHSKELVDNMKIRNGGKGNPNSKVYILSINGVEYRFEGRKELKDFINDYNNDNRLLGPNRVSFDGIMNRGSSKDFILVSIDYLNKN